jgi:hypothetical protein
MLLYNYAWMHYVFITYNLLRGPSASTVGCTGLPFLCNRKFLKHVYYNVLPCIQYLNVAYLKKKKRARKHPFKYNRNLSEIIAFGYTQY